VVVKGLLQPDVGLLGLFMGLLAILSFLSQRISNHPIAHYTICYTLWPTLFRVHFFLIKLARRRPGFGLVYDYFKLPNGCIAAFIAAHCCDLRLQLAGRNS